MAWMMSADNGAGRMQLRLMSSLFLGRRCGVSSREAMSPFDGLFKNNRNLSHRCGGSMCTSRWSLTPTAGSSAGRWT